MPRFGLIFQGEFHDLLRVFLGYLTSKNKCNLYRFCFFGTRGDEASKNICRLCVEIVRY